MVAIVNKFSYTGTVQEVTVPPGTISIDVYLWGGAGGGGGPDDNPGGPGTGGHFMKHIGYTGAGAASIASNIGNTLQVAVGGGAGGGSSGGGAPGGHNGKSLTDYSGGTGGSAGPRPYSGGGGGGGGATLVTLNGTAIHIAGGGSGGGGAGNHSGSTSGINTNSAHGQSPSTLGQNGGGHSGDGGGGGAGGGGFVGGSGGAGGSGDNTGQGGHSGLSLVQTGGTGVLASGVTPGGTGEAYYHGGSVGGSPASTGSNGYAVVVMNVSVQANTKVSGTWKSVNNMFTKASGVWKQVTAGYIKVGGAWKAMFNSGINFISTANGFGNSSGASGASGGSGGGGCFIAGTMISMHDGSLKPVEQVDIGDTVSVGGKVFATGKFLIDNLYDYNGIQVSGTHMVKEDGAWTRVEDSRLGKSLGDDDVIVYVFGNENRRIIINNTEFTDYFELSEQQELTNHGEQFFSNWQDHDRQIHDKNVNILNA